MSRSKVIVNTVNVASKYEVLIEHGIRNDCGSKIRKAIGKLGAKAIVVSNKKVFGLYGRDVVSGLQSAGFETSFQLIGDGERFKNFKTFESLLAAFSKAGISRTDVVVALGGGVVGDIAGFAAATHLRGTPYVQIPTTLLSMIDSSVGGKTGVNTNYGKNLVGAFYHPKVVPIDPEVLSTLPKREITAGLCEAVKQGVIADVDLFDRTVSIVDELTKYGFSTNLSKFLAEQINFKAKIVAVDERESVKNTGPRSRKILNFGHTFAHALEFATDYTYLKHGEAVGYGILFAAQLSKKLGLLDESVVNLLRDVVHRTGKLPAIKNIDRDRLFGAIRHDKKNIAGSLSWILLKGIGKPVIIPHQKIGDKLVKETIVNITSQ